MTVFRDRVDAGKKLARRLSAYKNQDDVVNKTRKKLVRKGMSNEQQFSERN